MTKKDYVAIAEVIASQSLNEDGTPDERIANLSYDLAEAFAAENPRFDRARFLTACGIL